MMLLSAIDKNLQGSKLYLCASFGSSAPDSVGNVCRKLIEIMCIM